VYTSTIEFQKQNLPHLHLMVTLDPTDRPIMPEQIDLIVSAEIPNPETSPRLHSLLTEFMMHSRTCWQAGACNNASQKELSIPPGEISWHLLTGAIE
jgi:hypothetical protein